MRNEKDTSMSINTFIVSVFHLVPTCPCESSQEQKACMSLGWKSWDCMWLIIIVLTVSSHSWNCWKMSSQDDPQTVHCCCRWPAPYTSRLTGSAACMQCYNLFVQLQTVIWGLLGNSLSLVLLTLVKLSKTRLLADYDRSKCRKTQWNIWTEINSQETVFNYIKLFNPKLDPYAFVVMYKNNNTIH